MSFPDLENLLESLDQGSPATDARRAFARFPFRREAIAVDFFQPGGNRNTLQLAARNLSRSGASLLHSSYLHPTTQCTVHLPRPGRPPAPVAGTVARCRHVSGTIHEVGIRFKSLIDVTEFLELNPLAGHFSLERVEPASLTGVVIYSDSSTINRKVLQSLLHPTRIDLRFASPSDPDSAWEGADLVLLDADAEPGDPSDTAARVRSHGVTCPIILLTSEPSLVNPEDAARGRIDAILRTPLVADDLLRAVAEYLSPHPDAAPAPASDQLRVLADSGMRSTLLRDFRTEAARAAASLRTCIDSANLPGALRICSLLQGKAEALGIERIASAARAAADCLRSTPNLAEARPHVDALCQLCAPDAKAA